MPASLPPLDASTAAPSAGGAGPTRASVGRIVLIYAAFGAAWILLSDRVLMLMVPDIETMGELAILKGWLFVASTSVLLLSLLRIDRARLEREIAARERSTQALSEHDAQLSWLENNLPLSYVYRYTAGPGGRPRFLHVSAGVEKLHQVTVAEVLRDAELILRQLSPDQRERLLTAEAESLRRLSDFDEEFCFVRPDGHARWIHMRSRPTRRPDGSVIWDGLVTDVTDRKRAGENLREEEERLRSLVTLMPDALLINQGDRIVFANQRALQLWRATEAGQVLGRSPLEFIHPEEHDRVRERIGQLMKSGENAPSWETRMIALDGTVVPVETTAALFSFGGRPAIQVIVRDITERKQAEAALRASRAELEAALESMSDAVFISDREGRLIEFNDAFVTFHRLKDKQACARLHADYPAILEVCRLSGEPVPVEQWAVPRALRGESAVGAEYLLRRKDTGECWIGSYNFAPVHDGDGAIVGAVVTARDVTAQKRTVGALQASEERLRIVTGFARVGLVMVDRTHRYTFANATYAEILNLPSPNIVGLRVGEVLAGVYEDQIRPQLDLAFSGERVSYQLNRTAGGTDRHYAVNYEPARNAGTVESVVVVITDITHLKLAEEKLRLHEAVLRETGRIAKVGGWTYDVATGVGFWTEEVARIHDLDPKVPTSKDFGLGFYTPESRARIEAALQAAVGEGLSYDLELEMTSAKGVRKWVRTIGHPVVEEGRVVRLHGSFQDISERHQMDEGQRRQQRRLALLADISERLVLSDSPGEILQAIFADLSRELEVDIFANYMVSPEGDRLLLESSGGLTGNQARDFAELPFGVSLCGLVAQKRESLLFSDLPTVTVPQAAGIIALGVQAYAGFPLVSGKHLIGTISFGSRRRQRYSDDDVQLMKTVVDQVVASVERTRLLSQLRDSEERFRQMAENVDEVFWMTDVSKLTLLYVSPAYARIWGRSLEELHASPRTWLEAIHEADRPRVEKAVVRQAEGSYAEEYRICRPDGSIRWIADRAFPVRDAAGRAFRVVGVARDITENRRLEEQFLRAQRMEAVGTLASGVAHDLNNILSPILMISGMLQDKLTSPTDQKLLSLAENSAQRGAAIVAQLLTFSRGMGSERIELRVEHLIGEMLHLIAETFPRNIEAVRVIEPNLPAVLADPTQIHQVLMNLCVNARDAMPGGGRITLGLHSTKVDADRAALHPRVEPGRFLVLSVSDTGSGIPEELRTRVFDPFFTTKEIGKGTGLGLSTVAAIAQNHGGFVELTSGVGQGSRFEVHLPAANEFAFPLNAKPPATPRRGSGETILFVDDEPAICATAQKALEIEGYRVITAPSGAEALLRFGEAGGRIDLLVSDVMMPGIDGWELSARLRMLKPNLPIVLCSGIDRHISPEELATAEISTFIQKPFDIHRLAEAVGTALATPKP